VFPPQCKMSSQSTLSLQTVTVASQTAASSHSLSKQPVVLTCPAAALAEIEPRLRNVQCQPGLPRMVFPSPHEIRCYTHLHKILVNKINDLCIQVRGPQQLNISQHIPTGNRMSSHAATNAGMVMVPRPHQTASGLQRSGQQHQLAAINQQQTWQESTPCCLCQRSTFCCCQCIMT